MTRLFLFIGLLLIIINRSLHSRSGDDKFIEDDDDLIKSARVLSSFSLGENTQPPASGVWW